MKNKASMDSLLDSFIAKLEKENIEVEFPKEDREMIEYQLLRYDQMLFKKLRKCFTQFKINKFLIISGEKEKRICWFDFPLNKIVINTRYLDNPEFHKKLRLAGKLAKEIPKATL